MSTSQAITHADFSGIHPAAIEEPRRIRELLKHVCSARLELRRGMNRRVEAETAFIEEVGERLLTLSTKNFANTGRDQVFFTVVVNGLPYFFSSARQSPETSQPLLVDIPSVIYQAERRDRLRRDAPGTHSAVAIDTGRGRVFRARVADRSPGGLGVLAPPSQDALEGSAVSVQFLDGPDQGRRLYAQVRNLSHGPEWHRIGLTTSDAPRGTDVDVEYRDDILNRSSVSRAWQAIDVARGTAKVAAKRVMRRLNTIGTRRADLTIVDYVNDQGEGLRAIVDSWGDSRGATAVVIPPAWGRRKETLLPLAATIVETFRRENEPVVVVRFDGIRKRGESYNDPECRESGSEHLHFTFSQGVRDIRATLDFLERDERFRPSKTVLVTFSAASIEGRRAMALEARRLCGWVCVVGSADLQSMMRVISGGVDYAAGAERGIRFGLQEILGVVVDIDLAADDAFSHKLAFFEDSKNDMATITAPITWIRGRFDAWMDPNRVRDLLSHGDSRRRRLLDVPAGHQLRSSREALEIFQLASTEAARMALGRSCRPVIPDLAAVEQQQRAERERLPRSEVDLHEFWRDYLLGRAGGLGIELMNSTTRYRDLMSTQVHALELEPNSRVLDLGVGTGAFPAHLAGQAETPDGVRILGVDYVRDAIQRARVRSQRAASHGLHVDFCEFDLNGSSAFHLPVRDDSCDRVLASLLLSYVEDPAKLLTEIRRVLRPGGKLVLSSLRPDADISGIYREGLRELESGTLRSSFGDLTDAEIREAGRSFLNDAARLLDLEEQGAFRFWDPDELERLLLKSGFSSELTSWTFGTPPQAYVVSARP